MEKLWAARVEQTRTNPVQLFVEPRRLRDRQMIAPPQVVALESGHRGPAKVDNPYYTSDLPRVKNRLPVRLLVGTGRSRTPESLYRLYRLTPSAGSPIPIFVSVVVSNH